MRVTFGRGVHAKAIRCASCRPSSLVARRSVIDGGLKSFLHVPLPLAPWRG